MTLIDDFGGTERDYQPTGRLSLVLFLLAPKLRADMEAPLPQEPWANFGRMRDDKTDVPAGYRHKSSAAAADSGDVSASPVTVGSPCAERRIAAQPGNRPPCPICDDTGVQSEHVAPGRMGWEPCECAKAP